ncbi:MAG: uridine kinase [Candidatus Hydrogenedentota bacterium]
MPRLIAIAGGSCSGKTTLANALARALGNARVIPLDVFYRDLAHLAPDQRAAHNFDHPDALEHGLAIETITRLVQGNDVALPHYDFTTHTRSPRIEPIAPAEHIILEGLYALHWEAIRVLAATRVFVDLEHETCLARRIARDTTERGRTEASVRHQYEITVRPMYDTHVAPTRAHAQLIIAGDQPMSFSLPRIVETHSGGASDQFGGRLDG